MESDMPGSSLWSRDACESTCQHVELHGYKVLFFWFLVQSMSCNDLSKKCRRANGPPGHYLLRKAGKPTPSYMVIGRVKWGCMCDWAVLNAHPRGHSCRLPTSLDQNLSSWSFPMSPLVPTSKLSCPVTHVLMILLCKIKKDAFMIFLPSYATQVKWTSVQKA